MDYIYCKAIITQSCEGTNYFKIAFSAFSPILTSRVVSVTVKTTSFCQLLHCSSRWTSYSFLCKYNRYNPSQAKPINFYHCEGLVRYLYFFSFSSFEIHRTWMFTQVKSTVWMSGRTFFILFLFHLL